MDYLDWIIAKREAEYAVWRKEREVEDPDQFALWRFASNPILEELMRLRKRRRLEIDDQTPLLKCERWPDNYRNYRDSGRWKRRRIRKLVSVGHKCEHPGCTAAARHCHHLHYDNVGFEENCDLEALCEPHHKARHPG
jgi:hypothetical protein